ncbi:DUF4251 domain-containing protein [Pedobacter aquatilis]|uniref:DUF4251 domain-containing protein n=1 Tax=Pedobacter aquatilis TaxID=351343 RepID=UPI0025B538AD|nr:DUF4251 domain-containing protein [Pedobacter aquatilis]MDN3585488.1 DUF4251 domain-containing protein [Pedobacter aquatilis]
MKKLKIFLSVIFAATLTQAMAQTDKETTARIITEQYYTFNANTALPMANNDINQILRSMPGAMGGGTINLTGSQYDLKVTKDSVVAYLPYYGRAFNAPYNPTEGGIKFKSKDFSYKLSKNKKGSYTVNIRTKDLKQENFQLTLMVSQNGYGNLFVFSNNKQSINFQGTLAEPKKD